MLRTKYKCLKCGKKWSISKKDLDDSTKKSVCKGCGEPVDHNLAIKLFILQSLK